MNRFRISISICLCLLISLRISAQQKLDDYMEHLYRNNKFMGSVAMIFNDSIIYKKSVGYADVPLKRENTANTKFRIASISKTFTAVLILQAVEAHRLKLDDKLSQYYPEIKNAEKITIQQMLQHRSGIFNFTDLEDRGEWESTYHTEKECIDHLLNEPAKFEPGTSYEYSNSNYLLLGFILQRIYNKPFATLLDEKICKVLDLKNTYFTPDIDPDRNEAISYNIQDRYVKNATVNFSNHPASGGLASTPTDVNRFLAGLFNGKLLSKESLEIMLPKEKGAYGMGIFKLTFNNPDGFEHAGRIENYISQYWYFPKEKLGIVSLANAINIDIESVNNTLLQFAYGNPPEMPDFNKIAAHDDAEFIKMKGTYTTDIEPETVTISSDGTHLVFQNSRLGQDYLPFEDKGNNTFEYGNIKLQFFPEKKEMRLEQGSIKALYKKQDS